MFKANIGVSKLDQYQNGLKYGKTEEEIAEEMLTEFVPRQAIIQGLAAHEFIELRHLKHRWFKKSGHDWFRSKTANPILGTAYTDTPHICLRRVGEWADQNLRPGILHETWLPPYKVEYDGWEISFRGKVDVYDQYEGVIHDHKFKISDYVRDDFAMEYFSASQWVMYCLMSNVKRFQYNIFYTGNPNEEDWQAYPDHDQFANRYQGAVLKPVDHPIKLHLGRPGVAKARIEDEFLYPFLDFCRRFDMFRRLMEMKAKVKARQAAQNKR